jgi:YfiR/HmsC-like
MTQLLRHFSARRGERVAVIASMVVFIGATVGAQHASLEYQVKAAYLFNFTKFVDWPDDAVASGAPLSICVAAPNPFGQALEETIKGELVAGRPLTSRVVRDANGCHVLFIPEGASAAPLLREVRTRPVLTIGESDDFLRAGGVVNFVMQDGKVRFEISQEAAARAQLRISSRLLRLALAPDTK